MALKQWQGHQHYLGTYDTPEEASGVYVSFSAEVGHDIHASKITTTKYQK
jgi:hypothetical protein